MASRRKILLSLIEMFGNGLEKNPAANDAIFYLLLPIKVIEKYLYLTE